MDLFDVWLRPTSKYFLILLFRGVATTTPGFAFSSEVAVPLWQPSSTTSSYQGSRGRSRSQPLPLRLGLVPASKDTAEETSAGPMMYLEPTVRITAAAAALALEAAEQEAISNGWAVTIAIADAGGVPLATKRTDGAFAASNQIATEKARTAALFSKETALLESAVNVANGASRTAMLSAPFVLMRGGVPLIINGICCGSVGVSGVQPQQDEQVARAAIDALLKLLPRSKL